MAMRSVLQPFGSLLTAPVAQKKPGVNPGFMFLAG
jgi:hypothetical protein